MRRLATLLLLAPLGAWVSPPRPVVHATLVSSEPAARSRLATTPRRVRLVFSEPVEGGLARIVLVTAGRPPITLAARGDPRDVHAVVAPVDALAPGGWRVDWRVVSADGHPVDGTFVFFVGDSTLGAPPARPVPPAEAAGQHAEDQGPTIVGAPVVAAVLRGAALGALMALAGMLLFLLRAAPNGAPVDARVRGVIMTLAVAAPLLLAAHLTAWLVHTAPEHRLDATWAASSFSTAVGQVELWRTGLALLALWAWWLARRPALALLFATAALLASGAVGHSAAIQPVVAVPAKAVHLAAGAAWLGGLLWLTVRPGDDDAPRFAADARRVSALALLAVIAVALSGVVQTLLFLPSLGDLVTSAYGRLALAKAAGLLGLVAFGAYNRQRIMPRLVGDVAGDDRTAPGGATMLRSSVGRELIVMGIIILLGGLLAYVPPLGEGAERSVPTHDSTP